jgi:hypothetical protein
VSAGSFRVTKPFYIEGAACDVGAVVAIDDNVLLAELSAAGRIAPADQETARRLQHAGAAWSKPTSGEDRRSGFVTHGSRDK